MAFISSYLKNNEKNLISFFFNLYDFDSFVVMCCISRKLYTSRKNYSTGKHYSNAYRDED